MWNKRNEALREELRAVRVRMDAIDGMMESLNTRVADLQGCRAAMAFAQQRADGNAAELRTAANQFREAATAIRSLQSQLTELQNRIQGAE